MATPERSSGPRSSRIGRNYAEQPQQNTDISSLISPEHRPSTSFDRTNRMSFERQNELTTSIQAARARARQSVGLPDQESKVIPADLREAYQQSLYSDPTFISARNELVVGHLGVVDAVYRRKFTTFNHLQEGLLEAGQRSLMSAAEHAKPGEGHFTSYALKMIEGGMNNYVRDETKAHLSGREWDAQRRLYAAVEKVKQAVQGTPTFAQILTEVNRNLTRGKKYIEEAEARYLLSPSASPGIASLDKAWEGYDENEGCTLLERTPAPGVTVEDAVIGSDAEEHNQAVRTQADNALALLDERERRIVSACVMQGLSQYEVAHLEGISQKQVSRLIEQSLARMRDAFVPDDQLEKKIKELNEPIVALEAKYRELDPQSRNAQWIRRRISTLEERPEYKLLLSRFNAQQGGVAQGISEGVIAPTYINDDPGLQPSEAAQELQIDQKNEEQVINDEKRREDTIYSVPDMQDIFSRYGIKKDITPIHQYQYPVLEVEE